MWNWFPLFLVQQCKSTTRPGMKMHYDCKDESYPLTAKQRGCVNQQIRKLSSPYWVLGRCFLCIWGCWALEGSQRTGFIDPSKKRGRKTSQALAVSSLLLKRNLILEYKRTRTTTLFTAAHLTLCSQVILLCVSIADVWSNHNQCREMWHNVHSPHPAQTEMQQVASSVSSVVWACIFSPH